MAPAWLFGGPQRGRVGPLLLLLATAVGLGVASTAALRRYTYDWIEGASQPERSRRLTLNVRGWGRLSALVVLKGKLMLRNRGPREQLLAGGVVTAFLVGMIFKSALPVFTLGLAPVTVGLLLPITYGQFAFAWHGGHFDGLLAHEPPGRLVRATLLVLGGLAVGPLALALLVVVWSDPFFAIQMAAFALYHTGVTCPLLVWTGILWNRRWVNPEQSRFTFSGGSVRGMVLMELLSVPPAMFAALGGIPAVLAGVASLGGLGLATVSLWLPRLETALRRRRHAMLRGFGMDGSRRTSGTGNERRAGDRKVAASRFDLTLQLSAIKRLIEDSTVLSVQARGLYPRECAHLTLFSAHLERFLRSGPTMSVLRSK